MHTLIFERRKKTGLRAFAVKSCLIIEYTVTAQKAPETAVALLLLSTQQTQKQMISQMRKCNGVLYNLTNAFAHTHIHTHTQSLMHLETGVFRSQREDVQGAVCVCVCVCVCWNVTL